ncbi:MAG TPA: DUF1430 domain-containing protein [Staphylococcus kloosii]|uniref:DUF1430 domain-containing protein n=1 Tax=Staphylococcus kloosii TaxID=29384 RepID=A0A921KVZ5_9STAP|nr:DUF1430 domain-containing protein [Staphylococcus kloosii]HJF68105.1 DUF1430 domain-containing protein [Staphylococcus kloosii]
MKKLLTVLIIAFLIAITFIFIHQLKELSYFKIVNNGSTVIYFNFTDEEKKFSKQDRKYFYHLHKKYNVEFTQETFINDNKVLLHTTDKSLLKQASNKHILKTFNSKFNIKVYKFFDTKLATDGKYYLKGNQNDVETVINLINKNVGIAEKDNKYMSLWNYNLDTFSILMIVMLALLNSIIYLHYLRNNKKQYKILYDLGYSKRQIMLFIIKSFKKHIGIAITFSFITVVLIYYILYKDFHYLTVIVVFGAFVIISAIIYIVLTIITILRYYKGFSKNKAQNNKYALTIAYMILTLMMMYIIGNATQNLLVNYTNYHKQQISLKHWQNTKNIYRTVATYIGQLKDKELEKAENTKYKAYYNSKFNKGFIASFNNYLISEEKEQKENNANGELELPIDSRYVIIDKNYLQRHNILTEKGEEVATKLKHDDKVQNLLVPSVLKKHEEKIREIYLEKFYFYKYFNKDNENHNKGLSLNIIYTSSNKGYFSYDPIIGNLNNEVINPIAIIEMGNSDIAHFSHYLTSSYYFTSNLDKPYDTIVKGVKHFKMDNTIKNVESIYNSKVNLINEYKKETLKYVTLVIITIASLVLIIVTLLNVYFKSFQFNISLKRHLGYSYWQIHKWLICFLVIANTFLLKLLLGKYWFTTLFIYLIILLIQTVVIYVLINRLNKTNANLILKGKDDD